MEEIVSLQHPIVKTFVKLRTSRKNREENRQIVLPGLKLCQEGGELDLLLVKKGTSPPVAAKKTYQVTEAILKKVTGQENPEPIAALAPMPKEASLEGKTRLLALDQIQDPGNMGTLLRTALALGWEGVFLTHSSVDPFNEKALRASMGASLRMPLRTGSPEELINLAKKESFTPLVADMGGVSLDQLNTPAKPLLILGSEAHGVSPELKASFQTVSIPITGIESLNVAAAGAILMYTLSHER